jgi:hypothetical protein
MNPPTDRNRRLIGRVAVAVAVVCLAYGTVFQVSGALQAIERIERIDNALADLSAYAASSHESIHERLSARGPSDDGVLAGFDAGVARRMNRIRELNPLLAHQTGTWLSSHPEREVADVDGIDAARRAYVIAARATAADPPDVLTKNLRLLDLRARKLSLTVETARDRGAAAKSEAFSAADDMVRLTAGLAGLLIAYLILRPVFGNGRRPAEQTRFRQPARPLPVPSPLRTTGWLPDAAIASEQRPGLLWPGPIAPATSVNRALGGHPIRMSATSGR